MIPIDPPVFEALEWDTLLDLFREKIRSSLGIEKLLSWKPTAHEALRNQRRTLIEECCWLETHQISWLFFSPPEQDPTPFLIHSRKGGALEAKDLYQVGLFIDSIIKIYKTLSPHEKNVPTIMSQFPMALSWEPLGRKILTSLDSNGELLDSASNELRRLRSSLSDQKKRLEKLAMQWIHTHKDSVQDNFIEVIEGRTVVPIASGKRTQIKGHVLAKSRSQQSLYLEPEELFGDNQTYLQIQNSLREEEVRILRELSRSLTTIAENLLICVSPFADLDVAQSIAHKMIQEEAHFLNLNSSNSSLLLHRLRHPLIKSCRPNDFQWETPVFALTGPNAGGKTVLLKSISLALLMAYTGMPSWVDENSQAPFFHSIHVQLGDSQNLNQGLSSFAGEVCFFKNCIEEQQKYPEQSSLIVSDEIFSSTDPSEATVLAQVLLGELSKHHRVLTSTHLSDLGFFLLEQPWSEVGSMEFFDGRPTYRYRSHEVGRSHALETALRYGLNQQYIAMAQNLLSHKKERYDEALRRLQEKELTLERSYNDRETKLRMEMEDHLTAVRQANRKALDELRDQIHHRLEQMKTVPLTSIQKKERLNSEIYEAQKTLKDPEQVFKTSQMTELNSNSDSIFQRLQKGDRVRVTKGPLASPQIATILEIKDSQVVLQAGPLKFTVLMENISFVDSGKKSLPTHQEIKVTHQSVSTQNILIQMRLDLRGLRRDVALEKLAQFLDQQFTAGTPMVEVITGHGSGIIKEAFLKYIQEIPYIREFRPGREGDNGSWWIEFTKKPT